MTSSPKSTTPDGGRSGLSGSKEAVLQHVREDKDYKPIRSAHVSLMGGDLSSGVP